MKIMGDEGKLFVFNRKEVFLLFIFVVLVGGVSFTAGIKVGQHLAYEDQGITPEDRKFVRLKSWEEEDADALEERSQGADERLLQDRHQKSLKEKFEQIAKKEIPKETEVSSAKKGTEKAGRGVESKGPKARSLDENVYKGKWTIQLGSYRDMDEARRFADGFKVRGYHPIINEVTIEGRGIWYRVGLGVFDRVAQAKEYIKREESLFQGQDYTIIQLQ